METVSALLQAAPARSTAVATPARPHCRHVTIWFRLEVAVRHPRRKAGWWAADYLSAALGLSIPTWGARTFTDTIELRAAYLSALRVADRDPDDLEALRAFMWS